MILCIMGQCFVNINTMVLVTSVGTVSFCAFRWVCRVPRNYSSEVPVWKTQSTAAVWRHQVALYWGNQQLSCLMKFCAFFMYVFSLWTFALALACLVRQTKLASSLVHFRAHYKIGWLYFTFCFLCDHTPQSDHAITNLLLLLSTIWRPLDGSVFWQ